MANFTIKIYKGTELEQEVSADSFTVITPTKRYSQAECQVQEMYELLANTENFAEDAIRIISKKTGAPVAVINSFIEKFKALHKLSAKFNSHDCNITPLRSRLS